LKTTGTFAIAALESLTTSPRLDPQAPYIP
jgi:hypothetical protein